MVPLTRALTPFREACCACAAGVRARAYTELADGVRVDAARGHAPEHVGMGTGEGMGMGMVMSMWVGVGVGMGMAICI